MPDQTDTLYQTYDKGLFRITGDEQSNAIFDALASDSSANMASAVNVPPDSIGSGVSTDTGSQGWGSYSAGKEVYNDNVAGYWLGIDKDGVAKISIGPSSGNHMTWDGSTLTVVGTVSIGSLNIPDLTTANSFHTDTSGNSWWGANVATGYTGANAYILADGSAVFKNITMGGTTIQYVITNSGIFSYGDGSDGDATISVDTTLTSDKYYNNLTVNAGAILNPGGYRIFVKNTLTLSGNGKISGNGNAGSVGQAGSDGVSNTTGTVGGGSGGAGGAALPDGYLKGSLAGQNGGTGGNGGSGAAATVGSAGSAGVNTSNSLGSNGVTGANGGTGGNDDLGNSGRGGGSGQAGGTVTASLTKLIANWHLATLLDITATGATIKYDNSASAGASGGGGGAAGNGTGTGASGIGGAGGGAGGNGSNGRIAAIYARNIVINSGSSITSNGGAGGNGGKGGNGQAGTGGHFSGNGAGGAGGIGGNGGIVVLVYNSLTNNGSITVSAGAAGAAGAVGTGGVNGTAGTIGTAGSPGTIYQFQLSL